MTLKEQLRKKADAAVPRLDNLVRQKEAILVWQEDDLRAQRLQQKLKRSVLCPPYHPCPIQKDGWECVKRCLDKLNSGRRSGDISCPAGFYLLWICGESSLAPYRQRLKRLLQQIPLTIECCKTWGEGESAGSQVETEYRTWYIDTGAPNAGDTTSLLLMAGTLLNEPLFASEIQERALVVESALCNAVERDLGRRLSAHMNAMLDIEHGNKEELLKKTFGMTASEREKVLRELPRPEDLPILDVDIIDQQRMDSRVFSIRNWLIKCDDPEDVPLGDVLKRLFGQVDERLSTEWLLDQVEAVLPERCTSVLASRNPERLLYRQPVRFLLDSAPELATAMRRRATVAQSRKKEELKNLLQQNVCTTTGELSLTLKSISPYLTEWETYVDHAMDAAWWNAVLQLLTDEKLREKAQAEEKILASGKKALAYLNVQEIPHKDDTVLLGWEDATPEKLLEEMSSQADFESEDLVLLIRTILSEANTDSSKSNIDGGAQRFDQTILLFDEQLVSRLEQTTDISGNRIFQRGKDGLDCLGNNKTLRGVALAFHSTQIIFKLHVKAVPDR